jgi:hypothetical protein
MRVDFAPNQTALLLAEDVYWLPKRSNRKWDICQEKWTDLYLYGILREEWKEPKMPTKTT